MDTSVEALRREIPIPQPKPGDKGIDTPIHNFSTPLPPPTDGVGPAIWDLVIEDMIQRDQFGLQKYGKRLRTGDGRDALNDLYQELLDSAVYIRKAIYERDGK